MEDLIYYLVLGGTYLFALVVRQRLMATYSKYARVSNRAGLSGAQVARDILDANGLRDVQLELARGRLTDHHDPRTRAIRLSMDNARKTSVAAMAVSAHEAAHALQDADDYAALELRTSVYPLVQAASRWGIPVATLGSIVFQFITLPVEFDASRRALVHLRRLGITRSDQEEREARDTLRAAAMTYVAGAASAAGFVLLIGLDFARAVIRTPRGPSL
jgi:Zn-dependent membrane protease YugP